MNCFECDERWSALRYESPVNFAPNASQSRLRPGSTNGDSISAITSRSKRSGNIDM
jgi:hypothetical protein